MAYCIGNDGAEVCANLGKGFGGIHSEAPQIFALSMAAHMAARDSPRSWRSNISVRRIFQLAESFGQHRAAIIFSRLRGEGLGSMGHPLGNAENLNEADDGRKRHRGQDGKADAKKNDSGRGHFGASEGCGPRAHAKMHKHCRRPRKTSNVKLTEIFSGPMAYARSTEIESHSHSGLLRLSLNFNSAVETLSQRARRPGRRQGVLLPTCPIPLQVGPACFNGVFRNVPSPAAPAGVA